MTAEEKLARQRLKILEFARTMGNVSKACRQIGLSRSQFYQYRERFAAHGLEGLKDRLPIHKNHPFTTPIVIERQILALSLENPQWGCVKLSNQLKRQGILISSPTIQKILIKHKMGKVQERSTKTKIGSSGLHKSHSG